MRSILSPGNILNNLGLKILGLFLAIVLWFHVATNREYDASIAYQFEYTGLPDSLVLGAEPVSSVAVLTQGSGKQLLRLIWEDRLWPIGLEDAKPGSLRVPLAASQAPNYGMEGLRFLSLQGPTELNLTIDSLAERRVPILSDLTLAVSPDYEVTGTEQWHPDSVTVRGPAGAVAGIEGVRSARVSLTGVKAPVEQEVDLVTPAIYGVSIDPPKARLRQTVERLTTGAYPGMPVEVVPPRGSDSCSVTPASVFIEIGGPESAMRDLTVDSITIRCVVSREDTTGTRRSLWVRVPEPLRVLKTVPDSVTVQRHERPRTRSRS